MSIRFPSTHWSLIARATGGACAQSRDAMGDLLGRYLRPLQTYLVYSRGISTADAQDLVQSFIAARVLEKNVLASADAKRGRFRTFLLAALNRFVADQRRKASRAIRSFEQDALPLPDERMLADDRSDPRHLFDIAWAREVVAQTVTAMQEACSEARRELWIIFESRLLLPALHDHAPPPYQQLTAQLGLEHDEQTANLLVTAKRMFQRQLRAVIGQYAGDDADVEEEIADLKQILSRG